MIVKNIENATVEELKEAKRLINRLLVEKIRPEGLDNLTWVIMRTNGDFDTNDIRKYKWYAVSGIYGTSDVVGYGCNDEREFYHTLVRLYNNGINHPRYIFKDNKVVEWKTKRYNDIIIDGMNNQ